MAFLPPVNIPDVGQRDYGRELYAMAGSIGDTIYQGRRDQVGDAQWLEEQARIKRTQDLAQSNADRNYALDLERLALDQQEAQSGGGGFEGTGMDAQSWNVIMNGPSDPRYGAAYHNLFGQPKLTAVQTSEGTQFVPQMPVVPDWVPKPTGGRAEFYPEEGGAPPATAATAGGAAGVGAPITVPGTQPKPSDAQLTSALYADRMKASDQIITKLESAGLSYWDKQASGLPLGLGNYAISDEYRQFDQAARDFINATLRRESGAVISPEEFTNAKIQYFPQPGDDPATIEQKRRNRQVAAAGIARAAGPSYNQPPGTVPATDAPAITSDAEYDALPSGTVFTGPDGQRRRKP